LSEARFRPRAEPSEKPRRVRGGVKLSSRGRAEGWGGARWLGLVEGWSGEDERAEGLEYAQRGQTKKLEVSAGLVRASVQGRMPRAWQVNIEFRRFDESQWSAAVSAMADQAIHAARLLAGEVPTGIEAVFEPLGLGLWPSGKDEVHVTCTCGHGGWCKHACCVAELLAQRLDDEPFLVFELRGMEAGELVERLREARASAGAGEGPQPVYAPVSPVSADEEPEPFEAVLDRFWEFGPGIDEVDLPVESPKVRQPLLRRLGPSPFAASRFPLAGLLATCYDLIGDEAVRRSGEDEA